MQWSSVGAYPSGCLPSIADWGQNGDVYAYNPSDKDWVASFGFVNNNPPYNDTLSYGGHKYNTILSCYHPETGFYIKNELVMCVSATVLAQMTADGVPPPVSGTTDLCSSAGLGTGPGGAGGGGPAGYPGDTGGGYKTMKIGEGGSGNAPPLGSGGGG